MEINNWSRGIKCNYRAKNFKKCGKEMKIYELTNSQNLVNFYTVAI
jgi:hypothetical protein